jgi:hypothetical protein
MASHTSAPDPGPPPLGVGSIGQQLSPPAVSLVLPVTVCATYIRASAFGTLGGVLCCYRGAAVCGRVVTFPGSVCAPPHTPHTYKTTQTKGKARAGFLAPLGCGLRAVLAASAPHAKVGGWFRLLRVRPRPDRPFPLRLPGYRVCVVFSALRTLCGVSLSSPCVVLLYFAPALGAIGDRSGGEQSRDAPSLRCSRRAGPPLAIASIATDSGWQDMMAHWQSDFSAAYGLDTHSALLNVGRISQRVVVLLGTVLFPPSWLPILWWRCPPSSNVQGAGRARITSQT